MSTSHIENQICLKVVQEGANKDNDFSFIFSLNQNHVYINGLSQDITYGWEVPQPTDMSGLLFGALYKPSTEVAFQPDKTNHNISLKGVIYTQINVGKDSNSPIIAAGVESLTNLKLQANKGVKWHIIGENGIHYKGGGKGEWYIDRIQQDSSHFITGLNALKVEFTINLKKYK